MGRLPQQNLVPPRYGGKEGHSFFQITRLSLFIADERRCCPLVLYSPISTSISDGARRVIDDGMGVSRHAARSMTTDTDYPPAKTKGPCWPNPAPVFDHLQRLTMNVDPRT
jgi:hypothetical protein